MSTINFKGIIEEADKLGADEVCWNISGLVFRTVKFNNAILFMDSCVNILGLIHTYDNYSVRKFPSLVCTKLGIPSGTHIVKVSYVTKDNNEVFFSFVGDVDKYVSFASQMFKPVWLDKVNKLKINVDK